ncbi:MAG: hypothetical protein NTW30_04910, partial [Candidatus Aenigmarchaeota archaeon]|nr:hypothetical protein [Candidatus Aenigmarchaeota archaeon]
TYYNFMRDVKVARISVEDFSGMNSGAKMLFNNCNNLEYIIATCERKCIERIYIQEDGEIKSYDREL